MKPKEELTRRNDGDTRTGHFVWSDPRACPQMDPEEVRQVTFNKHDVTCKACGASKQAPLARGVSA